MSSSKRKKRRRPRQTGSCSTATLAGQKRPCADICWPLLFSILVLFRPYELIPALSFLSSTAFYFALATLAIYLPAQLATEGNLTMLSTEVKAILAMTLIALLTMPIAKDPATRLGKIQRSVHQGRCDLYRSGQRGPDAEKADGHDVALDIDRYLSQLTRRSIFT